MREYREINDPGLRSRVEARYGAEIAVLQTLGFRHLAHKLETLGPFSAIVKFPIVLQIRRSKEVLVFPFPFRLAAAYVLLVRSEPSCIADCMGMGVKLYTRFSDHSILISSTLESHLTLQNSSEERFDSQIIRTPPCKTPEEAWLSHKSRIAQIEAQGGKIYNINSFADYVEISILEEADLRSKMA